MNMAMGAFEIEDRRRGNRGRGFGRNVLIALGVATLAGVMAFQALEPIAIDLQQERSAEVVETSMSFSADESLTTAHNGSAGLIK